MDFAGIIAEYDPLHNGHAWQIAQARAMGAQRVAVVMSCGLVQRGALPLLPERVRARAALECGADLIFALPAPYACAGAESFARSGVALLAAAGCDALVFGAETPDTALLMRAARVLLSAEYAAALKEQLAGGARSFAAARQAAAGLCGGQEVSDLLNKPNNNLAVEYCKAILEQNAPIKPVALGRQGAQHGQELLPPREAGGGFASASALRELWEGTHDAAALAPYVPPAAQALYEQAFAQGRYTSFVTMRLALLTLLRAACAQPEPFAKTRGISEGLENRLRDAVLKAADYDGLLDALTTVRYPRARMRRLTVDAALCYDAGALPELPPYLHVLGARRSALHLLKNAALPASTSLAKLEKEGAECAACAAAQARASDLGALCTAKPAPMGRIYTQKAVFLP